MPIDSPSATKNIAIAQRERPPHAKPMLSTNAKNGAAIMVLFSEKVFDGKGSLASFPPAEVYVALVRRECLKTPAVVEPNRRGMRPFSFSPPAIQRNVGDNPARQLQWRNEQI